MSADKFVAHARSLLGARWRHRGRKPWALDCIGLLVLSGNAAGLDLQDVKGYGREPWDDQLRKSLIAHFGQPVIDREPGDVALIRWGNGEPMHVGIIADHPQGLSLIHASNIHGVIEHGLSGRYLDCIVEVYRPWAKHSHS